MHCCRHPRPPQMWAVDLDDSQNTVLKLMKNAISVSSSCVFSY